MLQPERDLSRNPLFQVKFRLENAPQQRMSLPGIDFERLPQALIRAKLDLSMDLYETADGITGGLEYNTALFDAATVEHLAQHYTTLLQSIAENFVEKNANIPDALLKLCDENKRVSLRKLHAYLKSGC